MPSIEEHIRKAMEEGKFNDLPGKGKPLRLSENPFEDPEWRNAYRMLRSGGFTLPWIQTRQEIEVELAHARQDLRRAWEWKQDGRAKEAEWQRALQAFRSRVENLNKRISKYNLETPTSQFQRLQLNIDQEVARLTLPSLSDTL